jgi:hypothetical protein
MKTAKDKHKQKATTKSLSHMRAVAFTSGIVKTPTDSCRKVYRTRKNKPKKTSKDQKSPAKPPNHNKGADAARAKSGKTPSKAKTKRKRVQSEEDEEDEYNDHHYHELLGEFCEEKRAGDSLTWENLHMAQRTRLADLCVECQDEFGVTLTTIEKGGARSKSTSLVVKLVLKHARVGVPGEQSGPAAVVESSPKHGKVTQAQKQPRRPAAAAVLESSPKQGKVTQAQIQPYLSLISIPMANEIKMAAVEGMLSHEKCERIRAQLSPFCQRLPGTRVQWQTMESVLRQLVV